MSPPEGFEAWSPHAVVCFFGPPIEPKLKSIGYGERPIVKMSRCDPRSGLGAVLGDAEELYEAVHAHFAELRVTCISQFTLADTGKFGVRSRYKTYAQAKGFLCHSFDHPSDLTDIDHAIGATKVEPQLGAWLRELPKPAGIFTQQTWAGLFLCRCCELLGIRVPQDIAIVGSDGFDVALKSRPALTCIRVPADEIGYRAAETVAAMLAGKPAPEEIVRVPGLKLIVRDSTGGSRSEGCDIDRAMSFIYEHACEGITVNDVISHTQSVSRMTFHKRFVESTGMPPAKAILSRKLSEARRLVTDTKLSIGSIAGMCGYDDPLYFTQVFCKAEGVAPRDYRKL